MTKQLIVASHLEPDELQRRYRAASDPVARSHWQMLWHLAQGKTAATVAELTGYHVTHVRQVLHRYNDHGPDSICDHRHNNPGRALALSTAEQDELRSVLREPPADGGIWTSQKVADWLSSKRGKKVNVAPAGSGSNGLASASKHRAHAMPWLMLQPKRHSKKARYGRE